MDLFAYDDCDFCDEWRVFLLLLINALNIDSYQICNEPLKVGKKYLVWKELLSRTWQAVKITL